MEDLTQVYNELIMEHSMNSYNKRKLEKVDYSEIGLLQSSLGLNKQSNKTKQNKTNKQKKTWWDMWL